MVLAGLINLFSGSLASACWDFPMPYEPSELAQIDLIANSYIDEIKPLYETAETDQSTDIVGYEIRFLIIEKLESTAFSEQSVVAELRVSPHNPVPKSPSKFWDRYGRFVKVGIDLKPEVPVVFSTFCGGTYLYKND